MAEGPRLAAEAKPTPVEGSVVPAAPTFLDSDAAASWGAGLQLLVVLAFFVQIGTGWGVEFSAMALGAIGAYVGRNPLRHVSAAAMVLASALTIAPGLYVVAGGVVWPDSPILVLAVAAPTVGLGIVAAIGFFGVVRWVIAGSRGSAN